MRPSPARVAAATIAIMATATTLGMTAALTTQRPAMSTARSSPSPVMLLYTGEQRGYLEPCGCTKPQIGGLPRRAALLASLSGGIVVDNGDMVEDPGRQSQLKAEALAGFYHANRYAAINLGECD